ncbi:unnamed protein product [Chondrus crispus]|uniref:Uncharacterized protein n=1 Tax=Chondrus crispus TaxID=2769 RepID=R7QFW5_CHOCR|nr:unnamed protein product [Chondrus crispus]CDF36959.1 unnamed protein product [Chondrus crispus]|eukprot:XP_005716778.1 unnamed protein product [Chondrus crispus]
MVYRILRETILILVVTRRFAGIHGCGSVTC